MATFADGGTAHTASAMMKMVVDVSLTPPFTQFYSCGFDDCVKIWRKNEGEYVSSEFPTIGKCLGLIAVNKNIFIGEESQDLLSGATRHAVVSYDINTKRCSEAYLDFSMPVSAMDVSADGNLFVAGAEDYVLKFRRDLNHEQIRDRRDLNGLPVNISCSPSSKYVVVSTSDGQVTVYEVIELIQEKISFKTNRGFNVVENDTSRMQCAWHPTGMNLYIPSDDGIIVVACRDWTKEKTLLPEGASMEEFSICAISLEGRYLAAYSLSGNVYIYRTATYDLVSTITLETPSIKVLSMVFDPVVDEDEQTYDLLLMDESGKLTVIKDVTKPVVDQKQVDEAEKEYDDMFGNLSDDEDDIMKIKQNYGFTQKKEAPTARIPPEIMESLGKLKQPLLTATRLKLPQSFVSGSAPAKNGECYFKWNAVGTIKHFENDGASNLLIEFHDREHHPEIMMDNSESDFKIGDINRNMIALASNESLCVLIVHTFDVDSKRWSVRMPDNEEIENVAVGADFVAIYTNQRYIRVFTSCGTQRAVFSVDGCLVSMAANDSFLVLATTTGGMIVHSEDTIEHSLKVDIYRINALFGSPDVVSRLRSTPLALSPESSLSWLCFSTGGQICTMDSDFVVRRLAPSNFWMPIFEGSTVLKSEDHSFWPIAVLDSESHLVEPKMRFLVCKSSSFPIPSKKLVPLTEKWDLPLCDKESARTGLEADLIRNELVYSASKLAKSMGQNKTADLTKLAKEHLATLLKLFSVAMNAGKENRAYELSAVCHTDQGIQMMCNLAAKKGKMTLKNKIEDYGLSKDEILENRSSNMSLYSEEPHLAPLKTITLKRKVTTTSMTKSTIDREDYGLPPPKKTNFDQSQDLFETQKDESVSSVSFSRMNESMELDLSLPMTPTVSGHNPFKKTTQNKEMTSESASMDDDFFASLMSLDKGKTQESRTKTKKEKPKSIQSKLSFGSVMSRKENEAPKATQGKKLTGFDIWKKENEVDLRSQFEGDDSEFATHIVTHFRKNVTKEDKQRYKEMADSQSLMIDL